MSNNENARTNGPSFGRRLWNSIIEARTMQAEQQLRHYNRLRK